LQNEFSNQPNREESANQSLFPNHENATPFIDVKRRFKHYKSYATPNALKSPTTAKPATPPASPQPSLLTPTENLYATLANNNDDNNMDSMTSPVEFPRIPSPFTMDSNISITGMNDDLNEHEINALEKWPKGPSSL
jgi:hypothetical protein